MLLSLRSDKILIEKCLKYDRGLCINISLLNQFFVAFLCRPVSAVLLLVAIFFD